MRSRQAAVMLVAPLSRWMLMARLRKVAMTRGAVAGAHLGVIFREGNVADRVQPVVG